MKPKGSRWKRRACGRFTLGESLNYTPSVKRVLERELDNGAIVDWREKRLRRDFEVGGAMLIVTLVEAVKQPGQSQ